MIQKTYPLKITKKIRECENACTLVLTPKEKDQDLFLYNPAQFLSFHINISNQKTIRSYSLSGSPLLNEPLTTSIKKVEGGLASAHLVDHIQENDEIESTPPNGKFFKAPSDLKPRHYFIIAGGSGITPLFSIIKTVLSSDDQNEITLIYCNKEEASTIYKNGLNEWKNNHPHRFQVINFLSQPQDNDHFDFKGRLDERNLKEILYKSKDKSQLHFEYYLCGPNELMKMAKNLFIKNGVERKQIRTESFGSSPKKPTLTPIDNKTISLDSALPAKDQINPKLDTPSKENQSGIQQPVSSEENKSQLPKTAVVIQADEENQIGEPTTIKVLLEGEVVEIPAQKNLPILEQLIDAGFCPPFSCMAGNCMTCIATLKKGRVYQDEAGILDEDNIAEKEILTCQAKPLSAIVEVDYDS